MKTARPTKLFTDVLFYRGLGFLRNFLRTLIFTRHHQSNTWVFHRAGDVIAALLIAIIALIVNGINYWLDEEEEDRYGASCVFWLAEQQFNHSEISKRVIEAASKLGEGAFKKPGVLRLLILGILRPRRKGFNQTPSLVLDISTDELRILLAPLGRFLSLNVGRDTVILEDESGADCDHQLWALLCDALWYAVRTTPDDEQLLQSVSVILNTGRVLQWTMKPSKFSDLAVFGQHISRGLQALPQVELGNIFPTALTRLQHDQLTIFTFLFAAHLDYHIQLENISIPASEIPEPILLYAIVTCFEEASQGRGDIWSGRLRLLLLQHIPKMIIPLLEAQATCFVETLWNAQRMDELFWRNENPEPILKQRRDSLHLRTVRLLLVANHDFWYERLNRSGHIKYIWDLLGYGLPGRQIERRVELDILDDWFETERAQEVWGNMLIPLENFMAIWACVYADDRDRTRRLYHTRVWADVVENAIMRLGKVRSISINQFCYNITPQEMMQMMDSITRYIALVDARRTGFSGMMARTQLRLAFISFASHLMAYYNPLLLRFTSSTRCRMAWDSWRRDNYQERWRDRIRGSMSKFLQVARV
ncbi:hypothetical protein FRC03_001051 [Tulasnella sp. 419]|nr:hypothetical protein FRC03_001051 [Tulasnella sp. 419]